MEPSTIFNYSVEFLLYVLPELQGVTTGSRIQLKIFFKINQEELLFDIVCLVFLESFQNLLSCCITHI